MKGNFKIKEPPFERISQEYRCARARMKPGKLDGDLNKPFWKSGEWITQLYDIRGKDYPTPWKRTRIKMLWDEEALYVGAELEDDAIWANVGKRDQVIFVDNDFEVFLAPQDSTHRYFEIEINAANAVWDLLMDQPQRDHCHRVIGWDVRDLESAVKIDGTLNDPWAENRSWSLEMKIPWVSLRECGLDEIYPGKIAPTLGEVWRTNFLRVEWNVDVDGNRYKKKVDPETGKTLPENNWVWVPTGVVDVHLPEMWGYLVFTENGEPYPLPLEEDKVKMALRKVYYREHAYCCRHERFTEDLDLLLNGEKLPYDIAVYTTPSMFEAIACWNNQRWHIRQDGYVWRDDDA